MLPPCATWRSGIRDAAGRLAQFSGHFVDQAPRLDKLVIGPSSLLAAGRGISDGSGT